ncbi:serine/threonine-protein kinase HAL4/sat4 [Gonapodya sp. JEL0774]|nr:serine/threonine-protein kinase HAL4/sat4 [Gonapodya sp. JEL0774]
MGTDSQEKRIVDETLTSLSRAEGGVDAVAGGVETSGEVGEEFVETDGVNPENRIGGPPKAGRTLGRMMNEDDGDTHADGDGDGSVLESHHPNQHQLPSNPSTLVQHLSSNYPHHPPPPQARRNSIATSFSGAVAKLFQPSKPRSSTNAQPPHPTHIAQPTAVHGSPARTPTASSSNSSVVSAHSSSPTPQRVPSALSAGVNRTNSATGSVQLRSGGTGMGAVNHPPNASPFRHHIPSSSSTNSIAASDPDHMPSNSRNRHSTVSHDGPEDPSYQQHQTHSTLVSADQDALAAALHQPPEMNAIESPKIVPLRNAPENTRGVKYENTGKVIGWGAEGTVRVVREGGQGGGLWAAKVFKTYPSRDVHLARARWEYIVGSRIRGHPNVVQVVDMAEEKSSGSGERDKGVAFTVMEYLPGGNLRHALSRGHLRTQATVDGIFVQVIRALLWVHGRGVAHRDVKLENVMWHPARREVKLTDLGNCEIFWAAPVTAASTSSVLQQDATNPDAVAPPGQFMDRGHGSKWSKPPQAQKEGTGGVDGDDFESGHMVNRGVRRPMKRSGAVGSISSGVSGNHRPGSRNSTATSEDGAPLPPQSFLQMVGVAPGQAGWYARSHLAALHTASEDRLGDGDKDNLEGAVPADETGRADIPGWLPPAIRPDTPVRLSFGVVGTNSYIAPEQFGGLGKDPSAGTDGWYDSRQVDVWMAGVAYIYLCTQKYPWNAATSTDHFYQTWLKKRTNAIIDNLGTNPGTHLAPPATHGPSISSFFSSSKTPAAEKIPESARIKDPAAAKEMIRWMLEPNPDKRATLVDVASSRWFRDMARRYDEEEEKLYKSGYGASSAIAPSRIGLPPARASIGSSAPSMDSTAADGNAKPGFLAGLGLVSGSVGDVLQAGGKAGAAAGKVKAMVGLGAETFEDDNEDEDEDDVTFR